MDEKSLSISEIYAKGKDRLTEIGYQRAYPPEGAADATVRANRKYLDSMFFRTRFLNPVTVDTSLTLFGARLGTPIYSSAMSGFNQLSDTALSEICQGLEKAGSLAMLGIGGAGDMKTAVKTGVPTIKIIKPYKREELIFRELKDAEEIGCVAVGMDIDHFYGVRARNQSLLNTHLFGPQRTELLEKVIRSTKLPFIIKGVLHVDDALEAVRIGASAVVVSSHLWSTVEYAVPPIVALPDIVGAVGEKIPVLIDTGFKTGNDVLKALALGATAVGFASSILLAWGAGGGQTVEHFVNQLTAELTRTMASTGTASVTAVSRSIVVPLPWAQ